MTAAPTSDPSALAQGILRYLRDHPEAADSLEGIANWWLPPMSYAATLESVQVALDQMVAKRQIARFDLADGRTLYQRADKVSGAHPAWNPHTPRSRP
jgi:hypothetical protein